MLFARLLVFLKVNFKSALDDWKCNLISNIGRYLTELNKNPVEGFSAGLIDDDDIYQWEVVVIGPQDTLL